MKITLCIDKQARNNPSSELRQYSIDIGCPLRSIDSSFDELKISTDDNNSLIGKIIRRCYVDKYGVLKKLDIEETQELEIPEITLFEGSNYVYIKEFTNLNMKIEYLTNAEMNKYFASKVEMNTTIKQTYDSIMLSVSAKVDADEIISKINMSPEEITIQAKKLGLTANDILNIIAGNEINMTARDISIVSDNWSVDKKGHMECSDANVKGTITSNSGNIGGWNINEKGLTNDDVFINSDGSSTIYTVADLIIVRGYIMGTTGFELSSAMIEHYDFNGDGVVNSQDYVTLQNLIGISMN